MTKAGQKRKRKTPGKIRLGAKNLGRLVIALLLVFLLSCTILAVGYVIFFRTVFAQEIMPGLRDGIVFEEPDPPLLETEVAVEELPVTQHPVLPKVAIIMDDMGYHGSIGEELLDFPLEMTYSFLPFAPHTERLAEMAYLSGKTVLLHLPLQPKDAAFNPGPGTLYVDDSGAMQAEKFVRCLDAVPHAEGVNNHMGSLYTENRAAMEVVIDQIAARSMFFIDSYTTAGSLGLQLAHERRIKSGRRHIFLDNLRQDAEICAQLDKLVSVAERRGQAIGIAHPHRATARAIKSCAPAYSERVEFVGVKELLNKEE